MKCYKLHKCNNQICVACVPVGERKTHCVPFSDWDTQYSGIEKDYIENSGIEKFRLKSCNY